MHETVWLGRGGQGAFTAARLLGIAAMLSGKQAMALPSFGPERRGAPVLAYTRIDESKIYDRCTVRSADAAVILDESLLTQVASGFLTPKTLLILDAEGEENTQAAPTPIERVARIVRIPARRIARQVIGSEHTNSVLFGALVGLTGVVSQRAGEEAIRSELGGGSKGAKNLDAFRHAWALGEQLAKESAEHV